MAMTGMLAPWWPWREVDRLWRTMDDLLRETRWGMPSWVRVSEFPPVNVHATPDNIVVNVELPGVKPEDVDLRVTADTLTLKAERKPEAAGDGANYHRRERPMGRFIRTINLPVPVRTEGVTAKYANGILTVTLPKVEAAKPRRIPVSQSK